MKTFYSLLFFSLFFAACSSDPAEQPTTTPETPLPYKLICLGSTLTVGDTLDPAQAYPQRLHEYFVAQGAEVKVVNAGIKGETIKGAQERVRWLLQQRFAGMLLEVGNAESVQGQSADSLTVALRRLVQTVQEARPDVEIFVLDAVGWLPESASLPAEVVRLALPSPINYRQIDAATEKTVADAIGADLLRAITAK